MTQYYCLVRLPFSVISCFREWIACFLSKLILHSLFFSRLLLRPSFFSQLLYLVQTSSEERPFSLALTISSAFPSFSNPSATLSSSSSSFPDTAASSMFPRADETKETHRWSHFRRRKDIIAARRGRSSCFGMMTVQRNCVHKRACRSATQVPYCSAISICQHAKEVSLDKLLFE